jgi:hypothetical protein
VDSGPPDGRDSDSEFDFAGAMLEDSSDEERAVRGTALYLSQQRTVDDVIRDAPGSGAVLRRYLPPGRPIELYWQYVSWQNTTGARVGSYSSFTRVYRMVFGRDGFLKYRKKKGEHAICTACDGYKQELRVCRHVGQRGEIMQAISRSPNGVGCGGAGRGGAWWGGVR